MLISLYHSMRTAPSSATMWIWIADFPTWTAKKMFLSGEGTYLSKGTITKLIFSYPWQWRKNELKTIRPFFKSFLLGLKMYEKIQRFPRHSGWPQGAIFMITNFVPFLLCQSEVWPMNLFALSLLIWEIRQCSSLYKERLFFFIHVTHLEGWNTQEMGMQLVLSRPCKLITTLPS